MLCNWGAHNVLGGHKRKRSGGCNRGRFMTTKWERGIMIKTRKFCEHQYRVDLCFNSAKFCKYFPLYPPRRTYTAKIRRVQILCTSKAGGGGGDRRGSYPKFFIDLFRLCPPPPPPHPVRYAPPQLQSTCHYIVNHYVKIWHVRLGGANNMRPLSWGGGTNGKDPFSLRKKGRNKTRITFSLADFSNMEGKLLTNKINLHVDYSPNKSNYLENGSCKGGLSASHLRTTYGRLLSTLSCHSISFKRSLFSRKSVVLCGPCALGIPDATAF